MAHSNFGVDLRAAAHQRSDETLSIQEAEAWRGMLRVHARVSGSLSAKLQAESGLSLPEYELLLHLFEHPTQRMPMSELSRLVLLTPSGITRMVDRLEARALVRRQSVRSDARVQHAVLTDDGRELVLKATGAHIAGLRERFVDRLSAGQVEALVEIWRLLEDDQPGD
jgi:DNA-binding MarR family transcriptional regulator